MFRKATILSHVVENHVSTCQTILWIDLRIIGGGGFQESYQSSTLLRIELVGSRVEIGFCSCLDSKGIASEVNSIEIEREDVLLAIEILNLDGSNPLFRLHDEYFQHRHTSQHTGGIL